MLGRHWGMMAREEIDGSWFILLRHITDCLNCGIVINKAFLQVLFEFQDANTDVFLVRFHLILSQ